MMQQAALLAAVPAVCGQMTAAYRQAIVADHNQAKVDEITYLKANTNLGQGTCSGCLEYEYDMKLERVAQKYIKTLSDKFNHNSNRVDDYAAEGGSGYVGENWYSAGPNSAVHAWCYQLWKGCSEKQAYYGECNAATGHFTQVMWDSSYKVGCGYTKEWGTLCNYAPGGNHGGNDFFEPEGEPCSACPETHPHCNNGICSARVPCAEDGEWSRKFPDESITLPCLSRLQLGQRTRTCGSGGVWAAVVDTCVDRSSECLAEGAWPTTANGANVTIDCGEGFTGSRSSACANGWFVNHDRSQCQRIPSPCICTWDAKFPCALGSTCYGYNKQSSCENAGGTFCVGGVTDSCSLAPCGSTCGVDHVTTTYCSHGGSCVDGSCKAYDGPVYGAQSSAHVVWVSAALLLLPLLHM